MNENISSSFVLDEAVIEEIKLLARCGLSELHIAHYFELLEDEWIELKETYPRLYRIFVKAQSEGIYIAADNLMTLIKKGNLKAITYFLSNVGKFTQEINVNYNSSQPTSIVFNTNDPVEAAKIYSQLMRS